MDTDLQLLNDVVSKIAFPNSKSLQLRSTLSGGVISTVADGVYTNRKNERINVAVKHTKENLLRGPKFSHIEQQGIFAHARQSHILDAEILSKLQSHSSIKVPSLVYVNTDHYVTIMDNFYTHGCNLLENSLIDHRSLPLKTYFNIGRMLADVVTTFPRLSLQTPCAEDQLFQLEHRTEEMRISLYDNRMDFYNELFDSLRHDHQGLIWTDGHPKNIAVNMKGDVIFFDFGRSIVCDVDYVLPNFLAHIILVCITGCIPFPRMKVIFAKVMNAYVTRITETNNNYYPFDEKKFIYYIMTELVHRGKTMRYINPHIIQVPGSSFSEKTVRIKAAVEHLVDLVFDLKKPVANLAPFIAIIKKISSHLLLDPTAYTRPF